MSTSPSTTSPGTTAPDATGLSRAFEDSRHAWTRASRVRRRLVLAEGALLGALVLVVLAASRTDQGWRTGVVVWSVGLLAFVPLHSLLNLGVRGLFDRSSRSLDEHQRRLRERSTTAVGTTSRVLTLAAWAGAVQLGARTGHTSLAMCLGFLLWLSAWLLATWHLAWTLPDEDDPEPA